MGKNISEASKAANLPAKTIRYYEEIGLVVAPRSGNGYRCYSETEIQKLRFVQRSRSLGFTIENCRTLLSLYEDKGRASKDVKQIAKNHLLEVDAKIRELNDLRENLNHLIEHCAGDARPDCPIIDDLSASEMEPVGKRTNLH